MAVPDELPRLVVRRCETQPDEDVIQPAFELREQVFAGDAFLPDGLLEVGPKLVLENAVNPLHFLFFAKLKAVSDDLRLAIAPVLARREIASFRWRRKA